MVDNHDGTYSMPAALVPSTRVEGPFTWSYRGQAKIARKPFYLPEVVVVPEDRRPLPLAQRLLGFVMVDSDGAEWELTSVDTHQLDPQLVQEAEKRIAEWKPSGHASQDAGVWIRDSWTIYNLCDGDPSDDEVRLWDGGSRTKKTAPFTDRQESAVFLSNIGCSGMLLRSQWVLTAAHCVDGNRAVPRHPAVQVGLHGVNDGPEDSPTFEEFRVCRTIVHSQFDVRNLLNGYDIALLVLDRPSVASTVALLPSGVGLEPGDPTVVTGFGKIGNHRVASTLQKTEIMRVISNEDCQDKWQTASPGVEIKDTLLCVFADNGTDVCQGDSGGPVLDEDASVILGVVS
ncbi:MAG: serine protease, partial [Gemmatimonadetes bacterium]|nr:serine protease [Gemmatimonadota bacterium]